MTDYLHALAPGYRIEEYELVRVLGSGGFGITYLGYDHHLDKAVAIKEYLPNDLAVRTDNQSVLPKSTQDQADYEWGLARFLTEAQTLARFDHRHIIRIHRFFRAHGTGYSVMEYAEGETLSELLQRKGTLTESELKAILLPILDGLEAVHEADFLHLDIKPGNIVIREDGSPVLIDFGSARQAVAGKSRSVTAIVTPGYAPIEQYSVKGRQGPWTDIYALGAVCYRCLAGEPPDDATDRLREDPLIPAARRCAGKASKALLDAIDWALRVNEGERPQNIAAWREVLADGGKSGKHATRPVHKPVIRSAKEPAEARTGMSWSSLALVVIVVLLGASAWQGWQLYREMPGDGAGETAAVAEHQVDTQTGSQTDVALDAQAGNEVEVAPNVTAFDVFYEDEEETPQRDEESPPVAEPEAKPKPERFSAIHQPTIDRLWELSGFDNQDDKKRLEQTILDMSSDKQDAWYAGAHALIKQHDPSSYPQIVDDYKRYRLQYGQTDLPAQFLRYYEADEQTNQQLLQTLRQDLIDRQSEKAGITDTTPTTQISPSNITGSQEEYFTRGSHADDVLRLQGTPSGIDQFSSYEIWRFGISNVKIDLRTRHVLEWSNIAGNLKVRLLPGNQVTSEAYFTRGSHADDVLRLQGTPSGIDQFSSYEIWRFGISNVKIDLQTRRVLEWSNIAGNLKVKL